jgi:hypothetical protein
MTVMVLTEYTRVSCQTLYQAIYGFELDARAMVSWVLAKTLTMENVVSLLVLLGF